jgi:hypothetical protein
MEQVTQVKLQELNILELYEHYGALERSLPLLTSESQEVAKAELEACMGLRSEKIDGIYYRMSSHEDALERIKKESDLIQKAKRHHESQLRQLKGLINWLRRSAPIDDNKIVGRNYQFTLSKKKDLTVEISTDVDCWSADERNQFCVEQKVTSYKKTVVCSMQGEILSEKDEPKTSTQILPNLDAIRTAFQAGQKLPPGVKVQQEYSIRTKRIFGRQQVQPDVGLEVELEASEHCGTLLRED